ncbi:hypothetical protein A2X44_02130 [candidate division CPR3 bacterium GWF2_35_18]|uniref:Phage repressor like protein transcriptional regulator, XRE family n=1 Tax=candidate division CPR3 bacterium GW2011_GWF2_35_18 TaxID=1618350 RepID=A0A0G0BKF9_UNCC3|nr:MAG: Phage repressor like protein transcriptional regulator, XRE family [candidate division CPR3 bacterium GW2011_GWF2_35_18]KKP85949.1 MAG: Phage repressor like protein transcriptional regulator, XRE family [candidate division CPR3 bacterium GW2011_GWE2_35_7]OGB62796.1 MAG: hypothetical protein A2X44_02130 [candidate division CPR3 bacterium GWF2_35_18]OGB65377.1 MAG: hypothetical protein A2250_00345 [candidate division CPR3 bacterium RIFOXYA2_FULL_35_13]OGB77408.1 MAG: hypothetical protein 
MEIKDPAAKIKQARIEMGWSQQKLADETGFSNKTISAYEKGRLKANIPALQKIADAVEKPVSFFTDESSPDYTIETKLKKIEQELAEVKKLLQV